MSRCDWCLGFVRRDCRIMSRCVKTGMRRDPQGENTKRLSGEAIRSASLVVNAPTEIVPMNRPPLTLKELTLQLSNERANVAVLVEAGWKTSRLGRHDEGFQRHANGWPNALAIAVCHVAENALRDALSSVEGGR
jgi:hypothetical protein